MLKRLPRAEYDDTDPDAPVAVYLHFGTRYMLSEPEAHDLRRDLQIALDCITSSKLVEAKKCRCGARLNIPVTGPSWCSAGCPRTTKEVEPDA